MFIGVGVLKVKSLFRKLRKLALRYGGVIVFFDEADALGNRGARVGRHRIAVHTDLSAPRATASTTCPTPTKSSLLCRRSGPTEADTRPRRRSAACSCGAWAAAAAATCSALQALLAELSGLKKPRGFFNRYVRRLLGMQPKPPPKYRILMMMATNMPDSLDPALLRPGRIDRIYKVGYPSKEGRMRTSRATSPR